MEEEAEKKKKEDEEKAKDAGSDLTSKMDVKTKMALKKQQAKSAGVTKGDPVAALAMGLEKDVKELGKENKQEQKDIEANQDALTKQVMFDKYLDDKVDSINKELDAKVNKAIATLDQKKTPDEEKEKDDKQDNEIAAIKKRLNQLMGKD